MAEPQTPRDAAFWAARSGALKVSAVPKGAVNLNVDGRRTVGPLQGTCATTKERKLKRSKPMGHITIPEELFWRLAARGEETGQSVAEGVDELLTKALASEPLPSEITTEGQADLAPVVTPPDPYPLEQSLAILKRISGSLNIPDLDASKHDLYFAGLDDDDE
jgi:hypothetical protein